MGSEHIANLVALQKSGFDVDCQAVADPHGPSIEQALQVARPVFEPRIYSDFVSMLTNESELDVVIVATPNFHHIEVLRYILPTYPKLHVLCEKPMTTTVEDCQEVLRLCAPNVRSGIFWIGLEYRYMPPISRLIEIAASGELGRLHHVAIREHRFPFLVKVDNWNRFSRNTGGTLVEKCCHFFDLMNEIAQDDPVAVYASGAQDVNHLNEDYNGERPDILDNAYVVVNYRGGLRGMLDLCMFAEASENQEEVVVVGSHGKAEAFLPSHELRLGIRGTHKVFAVEKITVKDKRVTYAGHHYGSSELEHMDFYLTIRENRPPRVGPENGLMSVAMGVAAHMSIDQKRVVQMSEVLL